MAKKPNRAKSGIVTTGIPAIDRKLKKLEQKVQRKVARQSLRAGAKVVQAEAKRLASVDTGLLKSKIKVRSAKQKRRGEVAIRVGVDEKDFTGEAWYAAAIEYGTSKMDAKPFMGPAHDATKNDARWIVEKTLAEGVEREAAKG